MKLLDAKAAKHAKKSDGMNHENTKAQNNSSDIFVLSRFCG